MKIAVLSDLHLRNPKSQIAMNLVDLLKKFRREGVTELWFLGDVFDLLVGPFSFWVDYYAEFFEELNTLGRAGCKVLWLEGNHDFFIEELLKPFGVRVHDGDLDLEYFGRRFFLAHGDLVNESDEAYLRWRKATRSPVYRGLLARVPEFIVKKLLWPLGNRLSSSSRQKNRSSHGDLAQMYRAFAVKKFKEGYSGVFMGHVHIEDLFAGENGQFYLNLGSGIDGSLRSGLWDPSSKDFPKVSMYSKIEG